MAAPQVAGAALLARQYFMDGFYPSGYRNASAGFIPSGPLLKAVLVAGSDAMRGVSRVNGEPLEPPPSQFQGFGRVNLAKSLPLPGILSRLPAWWRLQVGKSFICEYVPSAVALVLQHCHRPWRSDVIMIRSVDGVCFV
jgi:hypothetical protein